MGRRATALVARTRARPGAPRAAVSSRPLLERRDLRGKGTRGGRRERRQGLASAQARWNGSETTQHSTQGRAAHGTCAAYTSAAASLPNLLLLPPPPLPPPPPVVPPHRPRRLRRLRRRRRHHLRRRRRRAASAAVSAGPRALPPGCPLFTRGGGVTRRQDRRPRPIAVVERRTGGWGEPAELSGGGEGGRSVGWWRPPGAPRGRAGIPRGRCGEERLCSVCPSYRKSAAAFPSSPPPRSMSSSRSEATMRCRRSVRRGTVRPQRAPRRRGGARLEGVSRAGRGGAGGEEVPPGGAVEVARDEAGDVPRIADRVHARRGVRSTSQ